MCIELLNAVRCAGAGDGAEASRYEVSKERMLSVEKMRQTVRQGSPFVYTLREAARLGWLSAPSSQKGPKVAVSGYQDTRHETLNCVFQVHNHHGHHSLGMATWEMGGMI